MKVKLGQVIPSYPMPVSLVGAMVDGKPNFLTVAWFSMMSYKPPMLGAVLGVSHYTNPGIKESKAFSLCLPGEDMVKTTDYAGIVSGKHTDKSQLFKTFHGETGAPMIEQCPLCVECELVRVDNNGVNELFVGKIVQVYAEEGILVDGRIDLEKIRPMLLSQGENLYYKLGPKLEKAWSIGKELK